MGPGFAILFGIQRNLEHWVWRVESWLVGEQQREHPTIGEHLSLTFRSSLPLTLTMKSTIKAFVGYNEVGMS